MSLPPKGLLVKPDNRIKVGDCISCQQTPAGGTPWAPALACGPTGHITQLSSAAGADASTAAKAAAPPAPAGSSGGNARLANRAHAMFLARTRADISMM